MKKHFPGFTLIEVLTVIAILGILGWGVAQINFNNINDKEKSQILAQRVIGKAQTIRNYSISGKAIGVNLYTPSLWRLEVGSGSGGVVSKYMDSGGTWRQVKDGSYKFTTGETVTTIRCVKYFDTSNTSLISGTGTIEFTSTGVTFPDCPDSSYNILRIGLRNGSISTTVEINGINGIIQET